jgi:hypothetical protein
MSFNASPSSFTAGVLIFTETGANMTHLDQISMGRALICDGKGDVNAPPLSPLCCGSEL